MWLNPDISFADCFKAIMKSSVYEGLSFYEVGDLVNSVKHDKPEVILPRNEYEELTYKKGLGRFFNKVSDQTQLT